MTLSPHLRTYLGHRSVSFDEVPHTPSLCASRTAEVAHIKGDLLAKGVLLRKGDDGFMLAVVPASHHIRFGDLKKWLGREVGLATETEIERLFPDCALGAIPPIGEAYGVESVVDDSLLEAEDVYFEGGDHRTLVHVSADDWRKLIKTVSHTAFSG